MGFKEFVADGADEAIFEGDGWDKACFGYGCAKASIGAEFFDADGRNGEPFSCDKGDNIEKLSCHQAQRIGDAEFVFIAFIAFIAFVAFIAFIAFVEFGIDSLNKGVHGKIRFVNIVVNVYAGSKRKAIFNECCHIFHIGHGFYVFSIAHHYEPSICYLIEEIINIASVSFSKNNRGSYDEKGSFGWVLFLPADIYFFSLKLCDAVIIKGS